MLAVENVLTRVRRSLRLYALLFHDGSLYFLVGGWGIAPLACSSGLWDTRLRGQVGSGY